MAISATVGSTARNTLAFKRPQDTSVLRASEAITTASGRLAASTRQHEGEQEFGVGQDEGEQAGGENAGPGERQEDVAEHLQPIAPVEHRRVLELAGDAAEEDGQDQDRERQGEHRVDQDQCGLGAQEAQLLDNQVEGGDQRHRRHQSRQDDGQEARRPAMEAAPGEGVGCRRAERYVGHHHAQRHERAVPHAGRHLTSGIRDHAAVGTGSEIDRRGFGR